MSDPLDEIFSLPTSGKDFDLPAARLATALIRQRVLTLEAEVDEMKKQMKDDYALKSEVAAVNAKYQLPMKMVYTTAGVMLTALITALVALVVRSHAGG